MEELAYFAGIVDGEGNVGIYSNGSKSRTAVPEIAVKMTSEQVIDLLLARFGGLKRFRKRQKAHWQDQWVWRVRGRLALDCAKLLMPLSIVKREALSAIIAHYEEGGG